MENDKLKIEVRVKEVIDPDVNSIRKRVKISGWK